MKVKELIEKLALVDPDAHVRIEVRTGPDELNSRGRSCSVELPPVEGVLVKFDDGFRVAVLEVPDLDDLLKKPWDRIEKQKSELEYLENKLFELEVKLEEEIQEKLAAERKEAGQ